MNGEIVSKFDCIGARVKLHAIEPPKAWNWRPRRFVRPSQPPELELDVKRDARGEYFDLGVGHSKQVEVVDVRPRERHLLLLVRDEAKATKEKFLCGHDERHWFVAAVPGRSVSSVPTAMEALKPVAARDAQDYAAVRRRDRNRRHNAGFIRQGEWFFVPAPHVDVRKQLLFRDEPLVRGGDRRGGKPHIVSEMVRFAGVPVYVSNHAPRGLVEAEYRALLQRRPALRNLNWRVMRRDAHVFARGTVRHSDHATIVLPFWHEVFMNRENDAPAMRHVVFLD